MINRTTVASIITVILISAFFIPWIGDISHAQTYLTFDSTVLFRIPGYNASIGFATDGSYSSASLENGTWSFVDFRLNNSARVSSFRLSAENCNVTILSCQVFNSTTVGASVRYKVVGQGKQTFNLGQNTKGGDWTVTLNGRLMGQNEGYYVSPDSTITVTGATANVTISYFNLSVLGGVPNNSNQPFYVKHSVAIMAAIVIGGVVVSTLVIRRKNQEGPKNELRI